MKIDKNKLTNFSILISTILVCIMLVISLTTLIFPDSHIFFKPYSHTHNYPERSYYKFDLTQNQTDYSYMIKIESREGQKIPTNNSYIILHDLVDDEQTESISIADYKTSNKFFFKYNNISSSCPSSYPPIRNFFKNISISVLYYDEDNDGNLSKNDWFLLNFFDLDKNETYDLNQIQFKEYDFIIKSEGGDIIGITTLNENPPNPYGPVETSVTVSSDSPPICLLINLYLFILLVIHLYFISKIIKNRKKINDTE